ncbi:MAG: hypothetical protein GEU74_08740 [Nitriliruptorales bacterium]|nr:hypothetical protein [Nitriliruptorales bacterium]
MTVRTVLPLVLLAMVMTALTVAPAAAEGHADRRWRSLLDRAAQAAEKESYVGESLWVSYDSGEPSVSSFLVQSSGEGEITVADRTRYAVRLGDDGGALADHERGWFVPLPAADLAKAHKVLDRVAAKYDVKVLSPERLLDRRCSRVEITRRADGRLVERLWLDDDSGLLLRRETYTGSGELLRMVSYLKLNLNPRSGSRTDVQARPSRGQRTSQTRQNQDVIEVDETGRAALREAGWVVPEQLPGGYLTDGSYALSAIDSHPLQTVYSDGLYTVSLFEQRGTLDPATLPEGAELASAFGFTAYTWPGAVPQRVVWEAGGSTWSLVGDAPPDEMEAMTAVLPHPSSESVIDRIARGLGRLWSWMSPWS